MLQQVSFQYITYIILLIICCSISFSLPFHSRSLVAFRYILSWAILIEVIVYYQSIHIPGSKFTYLPYHIYIPIEYGLLTLFFMAQINKSILEKIGVISIFTFIFFSIITSHFYTGWAKFPGLILNVEGFLLIIWSLVIMFSVKPDLELPFHKLPIFWICLSVILYHSGTFVMNGLFNTLKENHILFKSLRIINQSLNIIMYLMILLAFLLSNRMANSREVN